MVMKILNVVFSTTRQWNPGDEFIQQGVVNLIHEALDERIWMNKILFNRNPDVRPKLLSYNPLSGVMLPSENYYLLSAFGRYGFFDNSVSDRQDLSYVDLVVFSGTPEWSGKRLIKLYSEIIKHDIPTIFLGLGAYSTKKSLSKKEKKVLENALLITVRDTKSKQILLSKLKRKDIHHLPCPALFSSKSEKQIKSVKNIGLVFSTYKTVPSNRISPQTYYSMNAIYKKILSKFKSLYIYMITHYIDDLPDALKNFNELPVLYSYDSTDYFEIYNIADIVITPRLHGAGIAASMGIPSIYLAHDGRSSAAEGFMSHIINPHNVAPQEVVNAVEELIKEKEKIRAMNKKLIEHKKKVKQNYLRLIKQSLKEVL